MRALADAAPLLSYVDPYVFSARQEDSLFF